MWLEHEDVLQPQSLLPLLKFAEPVLKRGYFRVLFFDNIQQFLHLLANQGSYGLPGTNAVSIGG